MKRINNKKVEYTYSYLDKNNEKQYLKTSEHFLNATEIAEFFGLKTLNGNINSKIVKVVVDKNYPNFPKYYYEKTRYPMRVYDLKTVAFLISTFIRKSKKVNNYLYIDNNAYMLSDNGILLGYKLSYND